MTDTWRPRYRVTHLIEADSGHALNEFCHDTPKVFTDRKGYRVVSRLTEPVREEHYMEPAIARQRHKAMGTEHEERVTYSFPVDCEGWLATLMMRQGYGALPDGDGYRVVTSDEVQAWHVEQVEAEIAAKMEEESGE